MCLGGKIPDFVREILRRLTENGHDAYAVGGCVRDLLLGREPHDWDIATGATERQIERIFERTVPTGAKYGTVTVLVGGGEAQVTTFRRDGEYLDGRRPESVSFVGSLEEDLKRRDFTVNAMAMDESGNITDICGGRRDLELGVLRCVGDPDRRFSEDALRMLRAVRFCAQLGFDLDGGTLEAIIRRRDLAGRLSAERVGEELEKTLLSPRPEMAGRLRELGLLDRYLSRGGGQIPFLRLRDTPPELRTAVFALLEWESGECPGAEELLRALRRRSGDVRLCAGASRALEAAGPGAPGEEEIRALLSEHEAPTVLALCAARGAYDLARRTAERGDFVTVRELSVTGEDLAAAGLRGPEIGATLRRMARLATAGEIENTRQALLTAAANMAAEIRRDER